MKQRLGIAQALINYPQVIFLDEPTSAFGPCWPKRNIGFNKNLSDEITVFFSTHILSDVERICDNVLIIDKGIKKFDGKITEAKSLYNTDSIEISIYEKDKINQMYEIFARENWFVDGRILEDKSINLVVKNRKIASFRIATILSDNKISIERLIPMELDLETIFMKVVGE